MTDKLLSKKGFRRYTSIENSYQAKNINRFFNEFPELENEKYIVMEKLDGANISIIFFPDGTYKIGKRSGIISENENFNDVWNVIKKYDGIINHLSDIAKRFDSIITLYGEIFGQGIQKRINYGPEKYINIFDVAVNGEIQSFAEWIDILEIWDVCVPILHKDIGFYDAVNIDVDSDEFDNSEGIVIKPFYKEYINSAGKRFVLKKKNNKFSEKDKKKKKIVPLEEQYSKEVIELRREFESYLNKNRVLSCFSKIGEIETPNQIGEYIKHILEDMREDFLKDNDVPELDKKENKFIYDVSREIVKHLKEYL